MMKSWADHCSSDEEDNVNVADNDYDDDDEAIAVVDPNILKKEIDAENKAFLEAQGDDDEDEQAAAAPTPKTYQFPTEPPFTAYVGNLSYNIMDPQELTTKLTQLVKDVLKDDDNDNTDDALNITITDCRIMMDRRNPSPKPRHRGFAYIQVETLEMLQTLMKLNEKEARLDGRQLVLDTSTNNNNNNNNNNRRNSNNNNNRLPDGTQFRGGRFQNRDRRP